MKKRKAPVTKYPPKKRYPKTLIDKYANTTKSSKTEIKTLDNWSSLSQIGQTPQFFILNSPKLGSDFYNRIGNKISMKSVRVRIQLTDLATNTGTAGSMFVRILIFYDRQTNGLVSALSELLASTNNTGGVNTDRMGGINIANAERYLILRDEIIPIFSNRNGSTDAPYQLYTAMIDGTQKNYFDFFIKLKGLETRFLNNDGDEGSIATGGLFLYVFSNVATGGGDTVPLSAYYNARLRFYD